MSTVRPTALRAAALAAAAALLAACGTASGASDSSTAGAASSSSSGAKTITVVVAENNGQNYTPASIEVEVQPDIAAKLPQAARDKGTLIIGVGALPSGFPPLAFTAADNKTLTGSEPDFGRLVAAVLGLEPQVNNSTWENLFVGFDSGRNDVGFTNITVTEERKLKYDFASYRQDNLGFEVKADSTWNFDGDYKNLAGLKVAVGSGTNQEKILLEWQKKLQDEGKTLEVKYFPDNSSLYIALESGRIDASFGPNPSIAYNVAQSGKTRNAGTFSGAGETLQGLIAATTKKDSGWAEPVAEAINYLIESGAYEQWLKVYGLENEAVPTSEVNPAGLPLDNS